MQRAPDVTPIPSLLIFVSSLFPAGCNDARIVTRRITQMRVLTWRRQYRRIAIIFTSGSLVKYSKATKKIITVRHVDMNATAINHASNIYEKDDVRDCDRNITSILLVKY